MGLRSRDLVALAEEELRPGERLLWWGFCLSQRGKQRKAGGRYTGFFLGGFLGFWLVACTKVPWLLVLIPMLSLFGGVITMKRKPSSLYRKKRTIYAVTDQRVFALRDLPGDRRVMSIPFAFLTRVTVSRLQEDGRGIVSFMDVASAQPPLAMPRLRFVMVANAEQVKKTVEKARAIG